MAKDTTNWDGDHGEGPGFGREEMTMSSVFLTDYNLQTIHFGLFTFKTFELWVIAGSIFY